MILKLILLIMLNSNNFLHEKVLVNSKLGCNVDSITSQGTILTPYNILDEPELSMIMILCCKVIKKRSRIIQTLSIWIRDVVMGLHRFFVYFCIPLTKYCLWHFNWPCLGYMQHVLLEHNYFFLKINFYFILNDHSSKLWCCTNYFRKFDIFIKIKSYQLELNWTGNFADIATKIMILHKMWYFVWKI